MNSQYYNKDMEEEEATAKRNNHSEVYHLGMQRRKKQWH